MYLTVQGPNDYGQIPGITDAVTFESLTVTVSSMQERLLGDCNLDGVVDFFDITTFISILSSDNFFEEADCNQDGMVNFFDISFFITILSEN